jgi:putative mRNA 3-end processing factor
MQTGKDYLSAVKATGAEKVFVTHGFQSTFSRYLNENGIISAEVRTEYGNDDEEPVSDAGVVEPVPDSDEQNTDEQL